MTMTEAIRNQPSRSMRRWYGAGTVVCVGALLFALYLQWVDGVLPCPLCIFQRVAVILAGIGFLLALIINPRQWGRRVIGLWTLLTAGFGLAVATRQVWLQYIASHNASATCGPGLDYLLKALPWQKALALVFQGSGDCAAVTWRFLDLSLAVWSMGLFVVLIVMGLVLLLSRTGRV